MAVVGGYIGVDATKHFLAAGGDLLEQQNLLRNMHVAENEITLTTAKAQAATKAVMGTTIAENLKGMRELLGVMPNLEEAQNAYVPVMRTAKVLEELTGRSAEDSLQTLAKAIELRGGGSVLRRHAERMAVMV